MFKKFINFFILLQFISSCVFSSFCFAQASVNTSENNKSIPKVSVIIPVYNSEKWLNQCLDSVKNQTLKDIEIICINDGSTDKSGEILDEYAKNDSRFKVLHQEKAKISIARNAGLDNSTGEYITFLDSDDYLELDAYEVAYKLAKKDNVDILQYRFKRFNDGEDDSVITNNNFSDAPVHGFDLHIVYSISNVIWDKFFKADVIKDNNIRFASQMACGDDTCFNRMVVGHMKKMKTIPAILHHYRFRRDSVSHKSNRFSEYYKMLKLIYDYWHEKDLIKGREDLLLIMLVRWCAIFKKSIPNYAREILNSFGPDIYNRKVLQKCDVRTREIIIMLENYAKYPHKI